MYRPELVTAPAELPVTLTEAKFHCRVTPWRMRYEDTLITAYLNAAVAYLDGYAGILGRCLVTQTWKQEYDDFSRCMRLPLLAAGITSIIYTDSGGTAQPAIGASNYELQHDARGSFVRFKDDFSYPGDLYETKAVAITFTAGYGAAAAVPASIKAAILLMVAHFYQNREATGAEMAAIPLGVDALVAPYRMVGV